MEEPRWRRYLRFWGRDAAADVEDELRLHLELRAELNERRGLSLEQARAEAMRQFGDIERIRSECMMETSRAPRRVALAEHAADMWRDARIAGRSLVRTPLFAVSSSLALALGVGACAAVFAVVSGVLLKPLPYAEPERVVAVFNRWEGSPEAGISPAEYVDYAALARAFSAFGVYADGFVSVVEGDVAERVPAAVVTPGVFEALGVRAAAGRLFDAADGEHGAAGVAVLSHEYWRGRFHGAAEIIGRTVQMNGVATTIVGVLEAGVRLPDSYGEQDPPALFVAWGVDPASVTARGSHYLSGVGRLAAGWTVPEATAEVSRIARGMVVAFPDDYPQEMDFDAYVRPVHAFVVADTRTLLALLSGAVVLVLLIACANVSSLVLTRTEDRRRELAVRSALGAGRWRLVRQLGVEHVLLALLAAGLGLLLAQGALRALVLLEPDIPRLDEVRIDGVVVIFALLTALAATLLTALLPLRAGLVAHGALREGGARSTTSRSSRRLRRVLIGAEVALSIMLLAGAGLLVRSLANLLSVDPGYRTQGVLTVPISLPTARYADDASRRAFFAQLIERVNQLPGVRAAGAVSNLPLATTVGDLNIQIEGREVPAGDVSPRLDWQVVTPGWFEAMGIEIVRGRGILTSDDARAVGAVVLSESAARTYWPDSDPIGVRFRLGGNAGPGWVTVIGIVRDVRHAALSAEPPPLMYLPHAQFTFWNGGAALSSLTLVLHTRVAPLSLVSAVREHVRELDPQVPLGAVQTLAQVRARSVAVPRFATSVLSSLAAIALALAMIGIYGLVGYTVARRRQEIAVRMALGAEGSSVVRQIVGDAMQPVLVGAVIGAGAALALSGVVERLLYDIQPQDPGTLAAAVVVLCITALAASAFPARRATRIAPLSALREEG